MFRRTIKYEKNNLEAFLCQNFILTIYASKYFTKPNQKSLLEFYQPIGFYYEKNIYQLVNFCKYISHKGKMFYCVVPNLYYRKLLFNLAVLQDRDLALAKRENMIISYYKIPNKKCRDIKFLRNLKIVFNHNISMWYRIRINTIFTILKEKKLNKNVRNIIIRFLKWGNDADYVNMKIDIIKLNDQMYK